MEALQAETDAYGKEATTYSSAVLSHSGANHVNDHAAFHPPR